MENKLENQIYELLKKHCITLTTAESATGGLIASTLVNVPGISEFFEQGYVTYSDEAKIKMIHVDAAVISKYGVVSRETAAQMAVKAAETAGCQAALSVTGVAGPDGGTKECPVGTVYIGCCIDKEIAVEHHIFPGSRSEIRTAAAERALLLLKECILSHF